ncbi:MAG: hypothetical protein AUJ52_09840 [Elusimicrobia bacterium CG1_02_63_36]|nr:MAG: hypothetical protein AUJ52_09840 [Elusimicrobia bacterium CG1_02_63_36]PIP84280.1 MAG: hypothetical protein COR54_04840 [Elusimicrobia bacterium CG22_combo_CG10-13_8_21_14_all_63_91]PJA15649.1 MAG: hypothetical protein COX66_09410 [Elusimicrobia bacterium CG_4_10_14_0_2_um_filter_63_34]PJB23713.1 MAG: hypothetical protein CO113_17365 [Elusimicrobia bacterium CG_4_9_14_3_um_filter_62_55]
MRALLILALFSTPALHAGLWDAIKDKTKEAVKQSKEKRDRKKIKLKTVDASVRGLEEDSAESGSGEESRDYESLEWLESLEVNDEDVNRFVKEGRLAP